jgi:hypothetical protein
MTRSTFPKVLLAASLALLLSMPAFAAGHRTSRAAHRARISNPMTEALLQFWSYVAGALTKEGCGIDPSGRCITASSSGTSAPVGSDAGCTIDPDGYCLPGGLAPASPDAGCTIDPNGHCSSGS